MLIWMEALEKMSKSRKSFLNMARNFGKFKKL